MSKLLSTVAVAAFLAAGASAAQAGVIFSSVAYDAAPSPGEVMVVDFDHANAAGYSMNWSGAGLYQGPLVSGIAAPPFGDSSQYLSVLTGGTATLMAPGVMQTMSVYLGSIDDYNMITFKGQGGFTESLTGTQLDPLANGDQSIPATNRRFEFTFDPNDLINQVIFSSSGNSFEFDNIAVNDPPAPIPEPVTLSLFAAGLAGVAGLRRRKTVTA